MTGEAVNLSGDKEPELAPDAAENSNHQLIQNEWRLVSVLATIGEEQNQEVICRFFEDDFYNRCFDEMTVSSTRLPASSYNHLVNQRIRNLSFQLF